MAPWTSMVFFLLIARKGHKSISCHKVAAQGVILPQVRGFQTLVRICAAPALSGTWEEARAVASPAETRWPPATLLGQMLEWWPGDSQLPLGLLSLHNRYRLRPETLQLTALDLFPIIFFVVVEDSLNRNFTESSKGSSQVISPESFTEWCLDMFMAVLGCHCDWDVPLALSDQILGMLNILHWAKQSVVKNHPAPNAHRAPVEKHSSSSLVGRLSWDLVLIISTKVTQFSSSVMVTWSALTSEQPMGFPNTGELVIPLAVGCMYPCSRMVPWPVCIWYGLLQVQLWSLFFSAPFALYLICHQTTQCIPGTLARLPRCWSSPERLVWSITWKPRKWTCRGIYYSFKLSGWHFSPCPRFFMFLPLLMETFYF